MTNILDAVEPDAFLATSDDGECHLGFDKQDLYREVLRVYTMQPLYSRETVERLLKEELAEYEKHDAARDEKIRSLTTYHGLGCACSYDNVDDVCEHHSPKLMALTQQLAAANAKIDALMREYCQTTEDANGEGQKPTPDQAYYMMPCAQLLAQAQDAGTERRNNSIRDVIKGEDEQQ
jgi:hypothetical protein